MTQWVLYSGKGKLLVGKLISPGVRTFATVDRTGAPERVNRVFVHGLFPLEDAAFRARDAADAEHDPMSAKSAIKAVEGWHPLP